ncbi:MAG: amidophosphoribosyltransferase [Planctomycetes bacterium]|nr:amidophosphoribosyltransferase [Planctomycetota bacterium]
MCGVLGICGSKDVVLELYQGLNALQHRGQDAAGIATFSEKFNLKKGDGLVQNVFNSKNLSRLTGNMGIGHVRYPTVGGGGADDAQPFYVNSPFGIAMVHNGNLVNYFELKKELFRKDFRHLNSGCDVEALLNVFADELMAENLCKLSVDAIYQTVKRVYKRAEGSYSAVAVIAGHGIVAFRDPHGIKPLVMGKKDDDYAFASESAALDILGYNIMGDIAPGEVVYIEETPRFFKEGRKLYRKRLVTAKHTPCIFEWVYFARPDSVIEGINVYSARFRLGLELAKRVKQLGVKPDVVIPIPDTSRPAASAVAEYLKIPHREGLIKNRYIGRTFIMPDQTKREQSVRQKLNPIREEINGKDVLLVDDSIVRGTTSRELVNMIRSAGAKKVYFGVFSPPLRHPCVYGIDMQTKGEFIARNKSEEKIAREIGVDALIYQTVEGLIKSIKFGDSVCTACFTGNYPTRVPEKLFSMIENERMGLKMGC